MGDPEIDVIVVATRHASHAALTRAGLLAGKSVFCEKPLALSTEELDAVLEAAAASPGILGVGFNRRFSPALRRSATFLDGVSGALTLLYRVAAGRVPPSHWVHDLSQGGGRILGEVCHFVDCFRFLAASPIVEVYATAHADPALPMQARDNVILALRAADGSNGTIIYASDAAGDLPKEYAEASRAGRTAIVRDYREFELHGAGAAEIEKTKEQDKGHRAEVVAFLEGVRAGVPPVALDEIANVSLATLATVESLRTGLPVRLTMPA